MIGAPDVDDPVEATLELVAVIRDIGGDVGVFPVRLDQHPVLLISEIGRAEPHRTFVLEYIPALAEHLDRSIDRAALVEGGLAEPDIERDTGDLQRLLDVVHRPLQAPLADPVASIVQVQQGIAAVCHELGCPILDVVAVVSAFRKLRISPVRLQIERLQAGGEKIHLDSGVVVVILTAHLMPGVVEGPGDDIADHSAATVPDVERAVGVRRDELDLDSLSRSRLTTSVVGTPSGGDPQHLEEPLGGQGEVDEAGTGDVGLGEVFDLRQMLDDESRKVARSHSCGLGGGECRIRCPISVRPISRALHHELEIVQRRDLTGFGGGGKSSSHRLFDGIGECSHGRW